jgi:peptidoglycan/LPS O-acetylase OafA/YrhL
LDALELRLPAPPVPGAAEAVRRFFLQLRRFTTSGLYIPELDGLRFIAVLCVFTYHLAGDILRHSPAGTSFASSMVFQFTQRGNVGVPLFFVISGMIVGLPFARYWLQGGRKVAIGSYLLRRLKRLGPPYALALVLFFVLKVIGGRGTAGSLLPHLGASFLYLHNLIYREPSSINFVAWSLEVEVQFYLLAPVLAMLFGIRPAWLRRGVFAAGVLGMGMLHPSPMLQLTVAGQIQYFLAGFLLADLYLATPKLVPGAQVWDAVSVAGWAGLALMMVFDPQWMQLSLAPLVLVLYVAALRGPASSRVLSNRWLTSIGGMCYSIYLLHMYIIALAGFRTEALGGSLPFEGRLAVQMLLLGPLVLGISLLFYRFVEQPYMRTSST